MIRHRLAQLCCASLLAVCSLAWADLGRDDAAMAAQRATGGRVLSVDRSEAEGRAVWRVKLLTAGGEVRVVHVDAQTGQLVQSMQSGQPARVRY